ncbi:MAG: biotin/lipoyl-binding protein, partial [Ottowia sp.]|nr:biotin/lipoyl-binding protein [Ottowia sp.]
MKSFFSAFAYAVKKIDTRIDRWIRSWNPYDPAHLQERGLHPIAVEESQIRRRAARCFFVGMIVFLLWAFLAPIDSGVDVSGSMVVAGYRKSVQPSTGGVVEEIRVKEGDFVKQGDVLIKINPLNTEASLVNATLQYINLLVTESRLKSERLGKSIISWSPSLNRWEHDPRVQEAKALQIDLLKSRRSEHANQLAGLHAQVDGLLSSIAARKVQLVTLDEELASNEKLSAEGFVPKNATNAALRTKLEAQAILANTMADLGRVRAQIAQQKTAYERDIEHELSETQKNREAFQSRFEAAKFDRIQTEISAPVSGQVVGLKVFT